MARGLSRKQLLKEDDFVEKATDVGQWLEENWMTVVKVAAGIVLVAALVAVWLWNAERKADQRRSTLATGLKLFEKARDSDFASTQELNDSLAHFDEAIDGGADSATGRVASYYRAIALQRLGRGEEALPLLEALSQGEKDTLSGAAAALLADLYVEGGRHDEAVQLLEGLLTDETLTYPSDQLLLQLARIHVAQGQTDRAREVWQRVVDDFPDSSSAIEARQRLDS